MHVRTGVVELAGPEEVVVVAVVFALLPYVAVDGEEVDFW
jgi:hypothetical protein